MRVQSKDLFDGIPAPRFSPLPGEAGNVLTVESHSSKEGETGI